MKKCTNCKNNKELFDFHKNKNKSDGYSSECKLCKNNYNKEYRLKNISYFKEYNINYSKEYFQKILKNKRKKQRNEDILFRLKSNIHSRTSNAIKRKKWKKDNSKHLLLGCSFSELKIHLENKFTKNMNWNNYGEWHIDHIIPLSSANNIDELYILSNYTNLQPLWAIDNFSKGCKIY
jgi:hypothetical protein